MKRLFLLPLLFNFFSLIPAYANLDEANVVAEGTFDTWCGNKGNDCEVTFDKKILRVNNGKGITANQIIHTQRSLVNYNRFWNTGHYEFLITYVNDEGNKKSARFIFGNFATGHKFTEKLEFFTGEKVEIIFGGGGR